MSEIRISEILFWGPHSNNNGGLRIRWRKPDCGFGELTFFQKDNKLICDNEFMGRDFIKEVLNRFVDLAELKSEKPNS